MKFEIINEQQFDEITKNFKMTSFYQTSAWAQLKKQNNWIAYYVAVREKEEIKACSLILGKKLFLNKYMYYAPRGLLLDYNNHELLKFFITNIKKYLKTKNGIMFKIDPLVPFQKHDNDGNIFNKDNNNQNIINYLKKIGFIHKGFTKGYSEEIQFRWSYALDISKPVEELYLNMNQRCRRCLRKSEKYPLFMEYLNNDNILDFKKIMQHTATRQNHFDRTLDYYKNFDKYLTDNSILSIIYLDKEKFIKDFPDDKLINLIKDDKRKKIPISAGVFAFDSIQGNYVYGGTIKEYMPLMAQYKMQIEMIKESKKRNLKIYDFGGISGDFNENTPNYGVYEFKKGFGGYVIEYIGEFDMPISKIYYFTYNVLYKIYRFIKSLIAKIKR